MKKHWFAATLAAAMCLALAACGSSEGSTSHPEQPAVPDEPSVSVIAPAKPAPESAPAPEPEPEPQPEPEPVFPYTNPLTGEGCLTDIGSNRPVAVMLNNHKKALPQLGVSQADIIYEMVAEGGITRMMGLFQSVEDVGQIGSVRSARDYYVSLAYGHDAIFLHAGGSDQAYTAIKSWGVTALDCVNGPYEGTLYWRDKARRANMGLEHSVVTSGETIQKLLPTYTHLSLTHRDGFVEPLYFLEDGEKAAGADAASVRVKFSEYKTGLFTYDETSGLYQVSQHEKPYVDGNTDEQVAVKNVLVLYTDVEPIKGDDKGRQSLRTTGEGEGLLFCDGVQQPIRWMKKDHKSPMTFSTADGSAPVKLGVGNSYINIVDEGSDVSWK